MKKLLCLLTLLLMQLPLKADLGLIDTTKVLFGIGLLGEAGLTLFNQTRESLQDICTLKTEGIDALRSKRIQDSQRTFNGLNGYFKTALSHVKKKLQFGYPNSQIAQDQNNANMYESLMQPEVAEIQYWQNITPGKMYLQLAKNITLTGIWTIATLWFVKHMLAK